MVEYQCDFPSCTKTFKKRGLLIEHFRTHTGETPFQCPLCCKQFRRERNLIQHALVHKTLEDVDSTFQCPILECSRKFKDLKGLRRHASVHTKATPYKCAETGCHAAFVKETQLRRHLSLHTGKAMYPCHWPKCEASFPTPSKLKNHLSLHSNPKSYYCSTCSLSFANYLSFHQHQRSYHGDRTRFICKQCDRIFVTEINFKKHVCYICDLCHKRFKKKSNYLVHQTNVHPSPHLDKTDKTDKTTHLIEPTFFSCHLCDTKLKSKQSLQRHLQSLHNHQLNNSNENHLLLNNSVNKECTLHQQEDPLASSESLKTKEYLPSPPSPPLSMLISGFDGSRRFACSECSQTYLRQYDLDRHVHAFHKLGHKKNIEPSTSIAQGYLETFIMDQRVGLAKLSSL